MGWLLVGPLNPALARCHSPVYLMGCWPWVCTATCWEHLRRPERRMDPCTYEDRHCGAEGESLSQQEGRFSQLRGKDVPSDGWQKATVPAEKEGGCAAPHWGLGHWE